MFLVLGCKGYLRPVSANVGLPARPKPQCFAQTSIHPDPAAQPRLVAHTSGAGGRSLILGQSSSRAVQHYIAPGGRKLRAIAIAETAIGGEFCR